MVVPKKRPLGHKKVIKIKKMFVSQRSSIKFKEWKHIVASIVFFHIEKHVDDLTDHDYYKIYTAGIPASVMADIVIKQS